MSWKSKLGDILGTAFLLVIVVILGSVVLWWGPLALVRETWDMLRMRATTQATVLDVDLDCAHRICRPVIEYEYRVAGRTFRSTRLRPDDSGGRFTRARHVVEKYRLGQKAQIHYDPANPEHSCLEYGWFAISIVLTLLVLICILHGFRDQNRRSLWWNSLLLTGYLCAALMIIAGPPIYLWRDRQRYLLWVAGFFLTSVLSVLVFGPAGRVKSESETERSRQRNQTVE